MIRGRFLNKTQYYLHRITSTTNEREQSKIPLSDFHKKIQWGPGNLFKVPCLRRTRMRRFQTIPWHNPVFQGGRGEGLNKPGEGRVAVYQVVTFLGYMITRYLDMVEGYLMQRQVILLPPTPPPPPFLGGWWGVGSRRGSMRRTTSKTMGIITEDASVTVVNSRGEEILQE